MDGQTNSDNMRNKDDELAREIGRAMNAREGTSAAWGLKYEDGGLGWARASMRIGKDMLNGHGSVHGGLIFALADNAFAYACNSRNQVTVAQQASITFLSAGKLGEVITATAREQAQVGRSGVYTVKVRGEDGRMIAVFQGQSRTVRGHILDKNGEKT